MLAQKLSRRMGAAVVCTLGGIALAMMFNAPASAQTPNNDLVQYRDGALLRDGLPQPSAAAADQAQSAEDELPVPLRRQMVDYPGDEPSGTIIIDTAHTFLYLTLGSGKAIRYGIGVGRAGFTWSGVERISRKNEWPDWIPPVEMIARQPYLPRWVAGGPGNPLGARALYLGNTDYRIHGTNDPRTIGKHVSSGCIRLRNADVIDLYDRVGIGTKVVVLPDNTRHVGHVAGATGISIAGGRGRPMTARIEVPPISANPVPPTIDVSSNPTRLGLY